MNIDFTAAAIGFGVLLLSLTVHEAAHAWIANRLGDPTARALGRVSLNPIVHIDPAGTIILPIIAIATGLPIIGWAKPVPVNSRNLGHPRRDFVLVAAAGPVSNLVQACIAAIALRVAAGLDPAVLDGGSIVQTILVTAIEINVLLALFNLIPVPPLDGGNVLAGLLPPAVARGYMSVRQYGFLLLYALLLTGIASAMILPPTRLIMRILLP
ncbi:MAG: site-2 protease family protein [Vicinamibacterales bacterium]